MGRSLQLFLTSLLVLTSFPRANNQAAVDKVETCFHQNQPCFFHNVTCRDDTKIVILDELHAFEETTASCTGSCSLDCCQEGEFLCIHRVSEDTFARTFSSCWYKAQCQFWPVQEERVFTSISNCTNGSSTFGVLKHGCIHESSVRDFTDPNPAVGVLLMASFSSPHAHSTCVRPNSTLQCLVEREQGDGEALYIRVMLVMKYSTPGNCSKLHFTGGGYISKVMPCRHSTEYTAVDAFYLQNQIAVVLQLTHVEDEAWAAVQSAQKLRMTCGINCSGTTAVPPASPPSASPSITENTSMTDSAFPTESKSATSVGSSSTPPPSSSDSSSKPASTSTEGGGSASAEITASKSSPNVAAIVGGVIGSVVVIVIVIVVLVVLVCRRQRVPEPKAAAREPEQGHVVANSAYDDWDLDSGDGEGGTAHGSSPSVLPPKPAPAQRPVTDVYAKVNKKSSRVTPPPSPANTGPQPGHLPTCPPPGEVTDVYSRPKKGGKKHPDEGDNSTDVTGPEDASSPPVIPPRHFRSSEATGNKTADGTSPEDQHNKYDHLGQKRRPTPQPGDVTYGHLGNKMADNNTPEDQHNEYDHLGQKRRPTPQPGDVAYGHLGNKMAAEDPEASYDRLRSGGRGGGEAPGPAVLGSHVYGQLGTEGATEEGDKGPYDRLGGADRHDVMKDGVYHVASDVDTDPYSEHEPNIFEDD